MSLPSSRRTAARTSRCNVHSFIRSDHMLKPTATQNPFISHELPSSMTGAGNEIASDTPVSVATPEIAAPVDFAALINDLMRAQDHFNVMQILLDDSSNKLRALEAEETIRLDALEANRAAFPAQQENAASIGDHEYTDPFEKHMRLAIDLVTTTKKFRQEQEKYEYVASKHAEAKLHFNEINATLLNAELAGLGLREYVFEGIFPKSSDDVVSMDAAPVLDCHVEEYPGEQAIVTGTNDHADVF